MKRKLGDILVLALVLGVYGPPMASLLVFLPGWVESVGWGRVSLVLMVSTGVCAMVRWAVWMCWKADQWGLMLLSSVVWGGMTWGPDGEFSLSAPFPLLVSSGQWQTNISMGLGHINVDAPVIQIAFPFGALIVLLAFGLGRLARNRPPNAPT